MSTDVKPIQIRPSAPWSIVVGAIFGAITLSGLFLFAYLAAQSPFFICRSFQLLAGVFSLGAALSAAFLGGGASATNAQNAAFPIVFSLGGGVAVLIIAFIAFSSFEPKDCAAAEAFQTKQTDFQTIQYATAINQLRQASALIDPIDQALTNAVTHAVGASGNSSDNATCVFRHTEQAQITGTIKNSFDNLALLVRTSLETLSAPQQVPPSPK